MRSGIIISCALCFAVVIALLPGMVNGRFFHIPRPGAKTYSHGFAVDTAPFAARVVKIHDGDTISIANGNRLIRIRFYGVDSPEYDQPFGTVSARNLGKAIKGRTLRFEPKYRDKYNRIVAVPYFADGTCLLDMIIENGDAWVFDDFCDDGALCKRLREAQHRARISQRGLWSDRGAVPPSVWRSLH